MAGSENTTTLPGCINGLPKRGTGPGIHPDAELLFAWDAFTDAVTAYQCALDGEEGLYEEITFNLGLRIEAFRPKTMDGMARQLRYLLTKYIDCEDAWEVIVFGGNMTSGLKEILDNVHHVGMLWRMLESIDGPAERIARAATGRNGGSTLIPALGMTFADASAKVLALLGDHQAAAEARTDDPPDHLVVEACEIRRAVFTAPPRTPADALAVLNLLADDGAGLTDGRWVEGQETAVTLLRDFMARQVAPDQRV
ncbi:hypothetical protein [Azospirillum doebereinerae]|uniref:Uncharacterized protein n=1 Tax=Azospirillum doebereinerae TaxID=92933 RepID=A0A433J4Z1_9PROT|nr:hypothetical protein [Azospirillum doebereinerae]RUQ67473.1 hypothetical protein EJ913_19825 [Azospirillum doebereinerae]